MNGMNLAGSKLVLQGKTCCSYLYIHTSMKKLTCLILQDTNYIYILLLQFFSLEMKSAVDTNYRSCPVKPTLQSAKLNDCHHTVMGQCF